MEGHQPLRGLSGSPEHYGAAASQDFTPYEIFQGKIRSVLLIVYWLFLKVFLE
ncbi:DNA-packaging protein, partial [Salmonella enterica]|nr:DNA-packaging protein [Salmonella enterica]